MQNFLQHNDELLFWIVYIVRFVSMLLAIYNIYWSFKGFMGFFRHRVNAVNVYRCFVFTMSFIIFSFSLSYASLIVEMPHDPWSLFNSLLCIFACFVGLIGRRMNDEYDVHDLPKLIPYIQYCMVLVDLIKTDKTAADVLINIAKDRLQEIEGMKKNGD